MGTVSAEFRMTYKIRISNLSLVTSMSKYLYNVNVDIKN